MTNRKTSIDLLRILAILGVVLIHTTSRSLEQSNVDVLRIPWTLFLNQISRFAVPLFFLISGFVLELRYKENLNVKIYYKKRLTKLLIPYIFWSLIYYFMIPENRIAGLFNLNIINQLLYGTASIQFYFIPSIIILYAMFPLLHKYANKFLNNWFIIFLTFLEGVFLFFDYTQGPFISITPIRIAFLNIYLFIIGIIAVHKEDKILEVIRRRHILISILLIISMGAIFFESRTYYLMTKNINYIYSQWRPSIYVYTLLLASLLFYFAESKFKKLSGFIFSISRLTFFVFFVHIFFLSLFWRIIGSFLFSKSVGHVVESVWFDPLVFLFVVGTSFILGFIVSHIPKLRTVVGID